MLKQHKTASQMWNSLPDTVVSASTLWSFQHQLRTFFISTILYLLALCNSGLAVTFVTLVTLILFWLKPGRGQNLNQKWSGIRIRISGLIRIRIQMTAGLLPKCRRQSFRRMSWKSASDCIWNVNKFPKIPYSGRNGEESGKVIRNPYPGPEHHQNLTTSSVW